MTEMVEEKQALNPWVTMWTKPRSTIQRIVDDDPTKMVFLLAAFSGVSQALDRSATKNMGDDMGWPIIFLISLIAGPIGGLISLYIGGALIRWTGSWIGGAATTETVRAAIAWSYVPIIWSLPLWIPQLALFGQELFTTEMPRVEGSPSLAGLLILFGAVEIVIGVWTFVILLKSLGQVQGFSAWKAWGNIMLAGLVVAVPVLLIVLTVTMVSA